MINWKKSGLEVGTKLKVPASIFVEPSKAIKRLTSVTYVGEAPAGILVDCKFKPAFGAPDPDAYHYKTMINWASIWCGHVKVQLPDGSMLRARKTT